MQCAMEAEDNREWKEEWQRRRNMDKGKKEMKEDGNGGTKEDFSNRSTDAGFSCSRGCCIM